MTRLIEIQDKLHRLLETGRYPVNSRLPAERDLAAELGVSRGLLRKGLAQLEAEGRIWRNVGQGTFVGGRPVKTATDLELISRLTSPLEVMEVRLVIEPKTAWHAAVRASEEDVRHLRHCLIKIDNSSNHTNFGRWDSTFHRGIAEAAKNALLLALFDAVNAVRNQEAWKTIWYAVIQPARPLVRQQHWAIVDAIAQRNPAAAEKVTEQHIESIRGMFLNGNRAQ